MKGKWSSIVSPDGENGSLWIHQQAWFSLGSFEAGSTIEYQPKKAESGLYVYLVISGEIVIGDETLQSRDGLCGWRNSYKIALKSNTEAKNTGCSGSSAIK